MVGSGHSSSGMILGQGVKSLQSRCLPREELSLPDWAGSPSPQGEAGLGVRRRGVPPVRAEGSPCHGLALSHGSIETGTKVGRVEFVPFALQLVARWGGQGGELG